MDFEDTIKRENNEKDDEDKETIILKSKLNCQYLIKYVEIAEKYPFDITKERFMRSILN